MTTAPGGTELPLVQEVLPEVATELEDLIRHHERIDLATAVNELRVYKLHECSDDFCASFWTAEPPLGSSGVESLGGFKSITAIDVLGEQIVFVELLIHDPDEAARTRARIVSAISVASENA
jgi:hypothetical protein